MFLRNFGLLYPKERLAEIKSEHEASADPDKIKALNGEALALSLPTAEATSRAMRVEMQTQWQPVAQSLDFLVRTCISSLEAERDENAAIERALFNKHPMSPDFSPTALSMSFSPLIEEFKAHLTLNYRPTALPNVVGPEPMNANHTILETVFALPILGPIQDNPVFAFPDADGDATA
jgi:hypothetical protein